MSDPFPAPPREPKEPKGPTPPKNSIRTPKKRSKLTKILPAICFIIILLVSIPAIGTMDKSAPPKTIDIYKITTVYVQTQTVTCTLVQKVIGNVTEYEPYTVSTSTTFFDSVNGSVVTELQVLELNASLLNPCFG